MALIEVDSLNKSKKISVTGFDFVGRDLEMLRWLRRGDDIVQFIVNDVEIELYAQDSSSQLHSIRCVNKPEYLTKATKVMPDSKQAIVSKFSVLFILLIEVESSEGVIWELEVNHSYHVSNMDRPKDFSLRLDFTIVGTKQHGQH